MVGQGAWVAAAELGAVAHCLEEVEAGLALGALPILVGALAVVGQGHAAVSVEDKAGVALEAAVVEVDVVEFAVGDGSIEVALTVVVKSVQGTGASGTALGAAAAFATIGAVLGAD